MRSVEIRVLHHELRERMAVMRVWLDERRFEPSVFNCKDDEESVLIRIEFKIAGEAAAFAERFGGHLSEADSAAAGEEERDILTSVLPGRPIG